MFKHFLGLFYTDTGRDTAVVFFGTLINVIAGGLFFIFVPRILGPANYGLFSVVISTCLMVAAIANFGLDTGILRFAAKDNSVLGFAFKVYLALGGLTAALGFLLAPVLSSLLGYPQITSLLRVGFTGTVFLLLTNFFVAALQSRGEFTKASVVNISSNLSRLLILGVGYYFFSVNLFFLTALFFFITIVSVIIGKIYQPISFEKTTHKKDFFKYNLWIASALIISSIPFDNYILLKLAGPVATGIYAAPFKILTFAYQFGGNFTRVLASRYSGFDTEKKAILFSKKSLGFPVLFSVGLLLLILISPLVVPVIFGRNYALSVSVLQILSLGFIFFFISTIPSAIILYYFGRSNISFGITVLRYLLFIILLLIMVPSAQAIGAAWAFSLSELLSLILMSMYVLYQLQRR